MCTETTTEVIRDAVLIHTAGVQICRLHMIAPHLLVKWLVHFWDRTRTVQGATGLPRMSTEHMAEVMHPSSVTCIYPYSGCTKMTFAYVCSPYVGEVAGVFFRSYTYCTRRYGTAQHVYRTYGREYVQSLRLR